MNAEAFLVAQYNIFAYHVEFLLQPAFVQWTVRSKIYITLQQLRCTIKQKV